MDRIGAPLQGLRRCPHCGTADPNIYLIHSPEQPLRRGDGGNPRRWALYGCSTCGSAVLAEGNPSEPIASNPQVIRYIPEAKSAHEDLPVTVRRFLDQAFQTIQTPDAAAVMAGSAVDAMLKEIGFVEGSVYTRIDQALQDNRISDGMAKWAHAVRLGTNRPRHADKDAPHVSVEEASQSVEFAEALGNFLFVLTAKIQRGIDAATPS